MEQIAEALLLKTHRLGFAMTVKILNHLLKNGTVQRNQRIATASTR